jgi:MATE family multidrug resistance protein
VTQVGAMMLGVVDVLMVGQLGVHELDAAALGNVWLFGTMIFGMGIVFGLDPIVTQAHGGRDHARVALALQRGLVIAVLVSIPITALWWLTEPALEALGQAPDLAVAADDYVVLQIPSLPMFLAFNALRQYLQGRGIVAPSLWVMVLANGFNVLANWVLIFGNLGAPALGLEGAGIATALTRGFLLVALVGWTWAAGLHREAWVPWSRRAFELRGLWEILGHGLPVGTQYALEVWAFQIATLMAGRIGPEALAAHTIVINMASLSFMVPLGLSLGAATRVGNLIGAGAHHAAQRTAWIAFALGAGIMLVSATAFVLFREAIPALYTDDASVIALAATIFPIAAAFQVFDGTQVVGGGVLRGMGKTRPAALFNFMGYYLWALPIGWWFAFGLDMGLAGIWWALCVGLATVAVLLLLWVRRYGPATQTSSESNSAS